MAASEPHAAPDPTSVTDEYVVTAQAPPDVAGDPRPERYGKWLVFRYVEQLDETWHEIRKATESGELGAMEASCSTRRYNPTEAGSGSKQDASGVIRVFTSEQKVDEVGFRLAQLVKHDISYKTEEATKKGLYIHSGAKKTTLKTIYWNDGEPAFKLMGKSLSWKVATVPDAAKVSSEGLARRFWSQNVARAPPQEVPEKINGKWMLSVDYKKVSEVWHVIKEEIESGRLSALEAECPPPPSEARGRRGHHRGRGGQGGRRWEPGWTRNTHGQKGDGDRVEVPRKTGQVTGSHVEGEGQRGESGKLLYKPQGVEPPVVGLEQVSMERNQSRDSTGDTSKQDPLSSPEVLGKRDVPPGSHEQASPDKHKAQEGIEDMAKQEQEENQVSLKIVRGKEDQKGESEDCTHEQEPVSVSEGQTVQSEADEERGPALDEEHKQGLQGGAPSMQSGKEAEQQQESLEVGEEDQRPQDDARQMDGSEHDTQPVKEYKRIEATGEQGHCHGDEPTRDTARGDVRGERPHARKAHQEQGDSTPEVSRDKGQRERPHIRQWDGRERPYQERDQWKPHQGRWRGQWGKRRGEGGQEPSNWRSHQQERGTGGNWRRGDWQTSHRGRGSHGNMGGGQQRERYRHREGGAKATILVYTSEGKMEEVGRRLIRLLEGDIRYETKETATPEGRLVPSTQRLLHWNDGEPVFEPTTCDHQEM